MGLFRIFCFHNEMGFNAIWKIPISWAYYGDRDFTIWAQLVGSKVTLRLKVMIFNSTRCSNLHPNPESSLRSEE